MSDEDEFRRRMDDVKPLGGPRRRAPARPAPGAPPRRESGAARLIRPDPARSLLARAPDLSAADLDRLARGELRPDARIDLHRLRADAARERFRRALDAGARSGQRCLLVIHGRGRHGDTALRDALPDWLDAAASRVLAAAPARPGDGGEGATYVWLRRPAEP